MKIKYLGTGGGAGIPELLCNCPVCEEARQTGGKNVRTRSQAILDDVISIDFPVDAMLHQIYGGLNMKKIKNIIVTHNHFDHFLPADLFSRPQNFGEPLHIWASGASGKPVADTLARWEEAYKNGTRIKTSDYELVLHELRPYEPVEIAGYTVHPLKAHHAGGIESLIYVIEKDGHSFLWGHDTGELYTSAVDYLKTLDLTFDFVSLDCNLGRGERITAAHMDIDQCADTMALLREIGRADEHTKAYVSHLGHLHRMNHEELCRVAETLGLSVAYDGLTVEF